MFQDIKSILRRSLMQKGIDQAVVAAQVVEAFRTVVGELLGPRVAASLHQVALKGDTLQVSAGSSALAAELSMRQTAILQALSERFPGSYFRLKIFG
ncbi:MAG: hypothetical protein A2429_01880 [Candidatus Veblenbacteria bacterium RIFOXYC1_FULL_42_9]|uniref:DUF721 domain-containing protein n=1 Tax=Candidatus Veblenbacteria bacterium RIFOXYC1_FULL_42_9 TaxID=1802427 RepID=A0A1G2Q608_9BACT|nr:MAG: hypothetical protein A2429_01880 [Candidatus Veblenbacteria bacterium RIFOXYC1_FULL_42_9]